MMAKNPHFRVLALTATPGGKLEAVQTLIDGLHISRIEIRDENSLDLKPYLHKKVGFSGFVSTILTSRKLESRATHHKHERGHRPSERSAFDFNNG